MLKRENRKKKLKGKSPEGKPGRKAHTNATGESQSPKAATLLCSRQSQAHSFSGPSTIKAGANKLRTACRYYCQTGCRDCHNMTKTVLLITL